MDEADKKLGQALLALRSVLMDQATPTPPLAELVENPSFVELYAGLMSLRNFILALSRGDLDETIGLRGRCAGALMAHQSNLKHLTWQAQQIASGDLKQNVVFMGDFSTAFNSMVEQLQRAREELSELALRDPLTGLYNRRHLIEALRRELARADRAKVPVAVLMIDVDHFKKVNDTHGHTVGDNILKILAELLLRSVRPSDIAARYGGEEFIVVLPGAGPDPALRRAEKLRTEFETMVVETAGGPVKRTFSGGLAFFPDNGVTPQSIIDAADAAMYRAKVAGRNRIMLAARAADEAALPAPAI